MLSACTCESLVRKLSHGVCVIVTGVTRQGKKALDLEHQHVGFEKQVFSQIVIGLHTYLHGLAHPFLPDSVSSILGASRRQT